MRFLWQVNVISIIYCPRDANPIMDVDVFCSRVCNEGNKHNCISPTGEMHRRPTLKKVAIVAKMPHLIFRFTYL